MKRWLFFITLVLCIIKFQPAGALQTTCTSVSAPVLRAGKYAYVLPTPATPLSVRTLAGVYGRILATLAPGTQFNVPDGKQLAFRGSPQSSHGGIFAMGANGSNSHLIMAFGYYDPNWTPDGKQIVAGYFHDNKNNIARFDLQTSQSSDVDLGLDYQYV